MLAINVDYWSFSFTVASATCGHKVKEVEKFKIILRRTSFFVQYYTYMPQLLTRRYRLRSHGQYQKCIKSAIFFRGIDIF